MTNFRTGYEQPKRFAKTFIEPSQAHQCFAKECDINHIAARYKQTGLLEHVNRASGAYMDVTGMEDYQSNLNLVMAANAQFMELPAALRKEFNNNPSELHAFLLDSSNRDRAIELGLIEKPASERHIDAIYPPAPKPQILPEVPSSGSPGGEKPTS